MDEEFRVYDAIVAVARKGWNDAKASGKWPDGRPWTESDPLIFYGKVYTLANMVNRDEKRVTAAIARLKEARWLVPLQDEQRRKAGGEFTTHEYRVVEHDDYVAVHPDSCPPLRYDPITGRRLLAARQPRGLERKWAQKLVGAVLPDAWLDAVADAVHAKKESSTVTREPVTVGSFPEVEPRTEGRTRPTDGGAHTPHGAGRIRPTDGGAHTPHKPDTHPQPEREAGEEAKSEGPDARPQNGRAENSVWDGSSCLERHEDEDGHREGHEKSAKDFWPEGSIGWGMEGFPFFGSLQAVSGGRLNLSTNEWQEFGEGNQETLREICNEVLAEIVRDPWEGNATMARVMDEAATRYIQKHGKVPKSWLKVRSDLRDGK